MSGDIWAVMQQRLYEAHRDDLRPTRWRVSEETKDFLLAEVDLIYRSFKPDSLLGLPFVVDRDLTEPFRLETERPSRAPLPTEP